MLKKLRIIMFHRMHVPDKGKSEFDYHGHWKSNEYDIGKNVERPKYE